MERSVLLNEDELKLLTKALTAYRSKLRSKARLTHAGRGNYNDDAKFALYLEQAEDTNVLLSKITCRFL